jgi:hypothetical protein
VWCWLEVDGMVANSSGNSMFHSWKLSKKWNWDAGNLLIKMDLL